MFWSWPLIQALSLLTVGMRLVSAAVISKIFLKTMLPLRTLLLVPVTDLLSFLVWGVSLGGDTVRWSEYTFRVQNDGKMVRIG
jgi:hypothetical protein